MRYVNTCHRRSGPDRDRPLVQGRPGQHTPETLITAVLPEVVRRSGIDPADIDDIIFAESHYGGGDLARYAADATGMSHVPGQSVNRHCAGSLTAIGNASAQIGSGMERVLIAGGVQSLSMTPLTNWRIPGPELKFEERWMPPTHVETPDAPAKDMSITVGWNTAQAMGITREEMDTGRPVRTTAPSPQWTRASSSTRSSR